MSFIALVRSPSVYSKGAATKPVAPAVGIAYLAGSLRARGYGVQVIDAVAEEIGHIAQTVHPKLVYQGLSSEAIIERISTKADAIAFSAMFSVEWPHAEHLIAKIHKHFPHLPIIVGGEHATATFEYILKTCPWVTCMALGEGEETLCEFADYLDHKRKLSQICGIAYRKNGTVFKTPPRIRMKVLDELPFPAWDLIPVHKYHESGYSFGVNRGPCMPILATRGCPYECTFCTSPSMWSTRYYVRTPSKVVDEIEKYIKTYNVTNIDFYDLTLIIKREWIIEFCQEILKRKLTFTWQLPSGTRSEALDKEVLNLLYVSGCRNLCYAPESGSDWILKDINKKVHLEWLNKSLKEAVKIGIRTKVALIVGFPQESRLDIYRTIAFMMKCAWEGVDDASLLPFTPFPGTLLYNELRKNNIIPELNNDFLASLAYMDFLAPYSYCKRVGPWELNFYRITGLALFYLVTYLRKPLRILRTLKNLLTEKSETVFEQRTAEWFKRKRAVL